VAGGFALCVALVPGTAWAEDDPATPAPAEEVVEVLEGEQGTGQPQDVEQQEGGEEQSADETPEEPPPFEIPPELVEAFEKLAAGAGISEECVTGVTDALERIGNGIAGLPTELQQVGTDVASALEAAAGGDPGPLEELLTEFAPAPPAGGSDEPPTLPIGADIQAGLTQLAETLESDACKPAPPSEEPEPTDPPAQPAAGPQPPPQAPLAPAPQQPIQQGTYPGYAPTGAEEVEDGPSPAAIVLALAALAGGAVWTGRRWGAARH
jgi:hypothetical protein